MCVDCVKGAALATMAKKAKELGVQGVAWVLISPPPEDDDQPVIWSPDVMVVGRFWREEDPAKGEGDTGANYFNVAAGKLGEQLETSMPSGTTGRPPRKGEFGFRGGAIYILADGTELHTAFSGGSQDQDVQIAEAGMEKLRYGLDILKGFEDLEKELQELKEDYNDAFAEFVDFVMDRPD